jgi:hypothetical protein
MSLNPNIKFEPYTYREYPKMVYRTPDEYPHKGTTVNSPEEEFAILGYLMKDKYPKSEPVSSNALALQEQGERNFILSCLSTMGAQVDETLSTDDLRATLQRALAYNAAQNQPQLAAPQPAPVPADAGVVPPVAPVAPVPGDAELNPLNILTGQDPATPPAA